MYINEREGDWSIDALSEYLADEDLHLESNTLRLSDSPTIALIKLMIDQHFETGVFHVGEAWFFRLGDIGEIYLDDVPENTDVVGHAHPGPKGSKWAIPSIMDFIHNRELWAVRAFVFSEDGVIRYYPFKPPLEKYMAMYKQYENLNPLQRVDRDTAYLRENGCLWHAYPWENIEKDVRLLDILTADEPFP